VCLSVLTFAFTSALWIKTRLVVLIPFYCSDGDEKILLGFRDGLFIPVGAAFAGRDQSPQTAVDIGAPGVGTQVEALIFGH